MVGGLVIDLSMIIRSEAVAVTSMTLKDFAEHIIKKLQIMSVKDDVQRLDIVLDTYNAFSVKSVTREERGVGSLTSINLFHSLLQGPQAGLGGDVFVTYGKGVRSRSDGNVDIMRWILDRWGARGG